MKPLREKGTELELIIDNRILICMSLIKYKTLKFRTTSLRMKNFKSHLTLAPQNNLVIVSKGIRLMEEIIKVLK